jgi:hypothetical protein
VVFPPEGNDWIDFSTQEGRRTEPIAGTVAGDNDLILTREELLATEGGPEALDRWEAGDDSVWEEDQRRGLEDARLEDARMGRE